MQAMELLKENLHRPAPVDAAAKVTRLPRATRAPADIALPERNVRSYPYPVSTAWIYQPARSVTQSGRASARRWVLRFEPREPSVPDPLMGWSSSGDTLQQVELKFPS